MIRPELTLRLQNSPGALARICDLLSAERVNVIALSLEVTGSLRLVVDNHVHARGVLAERHYEVTERDALVVRIANNPGALAAIARMLAAAGVNVDYVYAASGENDRPLPSWSVCPTRCVSPPPPGCNLLRQVLFAFALLASAAAPSQPARTIAFTNVTVIDGTGAPPRGARRSSFAAIASPTSRWQAPRRDAEVIDGTGRFMIPGLWDMRVHLTNTTELAGPAFIANGVTGVRDCGGELEVIDWIRHRFESGAIAGPRVFRAGPFVDGLKPGVADRIVIGTEEKAAAS